MENDDKIKDLLKKITNICYIIKYPVEEDEEEIMYLTEIRDNLLAEYMELRKY